jgi:hypothetical protein
MWQAVPGVVLQTAPDAIRVRIAEVFKFVGKTPKPNFKKDHPKRVNVVKDGEPWAVSWSPLPIRVAINVSFETIILFRCGTITLFTGKFEADNERFAVNGPEAICGN